MQLSQQMLLALLAPLTALTGRSHAGSGNWVEPSGCLWGRCVFICIFFFGWEKRRMAGVKLLTCLAVVLVLVGGAWCAPDSFWLGGVFEGWQRA